MRTKPPIQFASPGTTPSSHPSPPPARGRTRVEAGCGVEGEEQQEPAVVAGADAIVQPGAVVVEADDAPVAQAAVLHAWRPVAEPHLTFDLLGPCNVVPECRKATVPSCTDVFSAQRDARAYCFCPSLFLVSLCLSACVHKCTIPPQSASTARLGHHKTATKPSRFLQRWQLRRHCCSTQRRPDDVAHGAHLFLAVHVEIPRIVAETL